MDTTTHSTGGTFDVAATPAEAMPGKRRMARQPSTPAGSPPDARKDKSPASAPRKIASVVALLERTQGATLAEMVAATGWLPHTTRAALTGLKKKGHMVTSTKADGVRTYRLPTAESAPITPPAETAKVGA